MAIPTPETIDAPTLAAAVRRALGRGATPLDGWRAESLANSLGASTGGVYRLEGVAADRGETVPWALVLKLVCPPPAAGPGGQGLTPADPAHYDYWKREALVYRSGLLDDLPDGLAAPRCFGVEERRDGSLGLWLEAVDDSAGRTWPLDCYRHVARDLGRFNAAYLNGLPVPDQDWLSRDWLRGFRLRWGPYRDAGLARDPAAWDGPLARRAFPRPQGDRVLRLWDAAEALCAALDRLPRTFCHRDANRTNLFRRGEGRTVAVDWAFAGDGGVGEEIAQLVVSTPWRGEEAPGDAAGLSEAAWSGYLAGLRGAGWRGDARLARLGYAASAVARWDVVPGMALRLANDAPLRAEFEAATRRPIGAVLASLAATSHLLLDLADEARELAGIAR